MCDLEAVLMGTWSIHDDLMSLQRCVEDLLPEEYDFRFVYFWLQFHGLPISMMNITKVTKLAQRIGTTKPITEEDATKWGRFARARVLIDTTQPLPRDFIITLASKKKRTVQIKYEKLPRVCYFCGFFGNQMKQCPSLSKVLEDNNIPPKDFSSKMSDPKPARYSDFLHANFKPSSNLVTEKTVGTCLENNVSY
ncbi:uncharacterized protein LOC113278897 [Papaver somniferum]|uniref:uncharacterized protein LOC113278897 n=1 Tax=Papaver somniferum TaxID=3469 RepID=UPI000E702302|nr:uncharacterized protein LOC113278897 [Papaver somniferum]